MISNSDVVRQPSRRIVLLTRIKQTTMRLGSRTQAFFRRGKSWRPPDSRTSPMTIRRWFRPSWGSAASTEFHAIARRCWLPFCCSPRRPSSYSGGSQRATSPTGRRASRPPAGQGVQRMAPPRDIRQVQALTLSERSTAARPRYRRWLWGACCPGRSSASCSPERSN